MSQATTTLDPRTDEVREAALRAFREEDSERRLAPVVAVIAALDEAESIGTVLREIPRRACDLDVDVVVVDDGSTDGTSRIARDYGARYIVTLDADGQWNPAELERVLEPLAAGEADFVIGSRVLGGAETDDRFRHAGVHVFAALVRVLTGVKVTDTSSGFRAMKAEVTATVRQEQVQYQTSELLIGAIAQGYRIAERPIVMRKRFAGESKKGHNLIYGFRYCRVILTTWLRERPKRVR